MEQLLCVTLLFHRVLAYPPLFVPVLFYFFYFFAPPIFVFCFFFSFSFFPFPSLIIFFWKSFMVAISVMDIKWSWFILFFFLFFPFFPSPSGSALLSYVLISSPLLLTPSCLLAGLVFSFLQLRVLGWKGLGEMELGVGFFIVIILLFLFLSSLCFSLSSFNYRSIN